MEGILDTIDTLDSRQFLIAVKRLADSLSYGMDRSPFLGSGIEFVQSRIERVDLPARTVHLATRPPLGYDVLIVASGAALAPEETEGLAEAFADAFSDVELGPEFAARAFGVAKEVDELGGAVAFAALRDVRRDGE